MTPPTHNFATPSKQRSRFAWAWLGLAFGLMVIATVSAVAWLQERPSPTANGPLELKRGEEFLPNSTMKAYGLRLPRAGRLAINLSSESGENFSVYLVGLQTNRPPGRGNELRLVETFTAERVSTYSRSAMVEPGEYHLTLVNSAPAERARELSLSMLVFLER